MEIYLDNSATTKPTDKVNELMMKVLCEDYGNPSSMHLMGIRAENYIKEASRIIADSLKVSKKEIIFTSGGTEANNLAIIGACMANIRSGRHIITTLIEHPSVSQTFAYLKENGFEVSTVSVDKYGKIIKDQLYDLIREDTILVSMIYVNNEIGAVQDVEEIASEIKKRKKNLLLHVDGVQAFGKYRIYPKRQGIDLLTFSGHKIHGPKGSGVLFANEKVKINPVMFGGGHQRGLRSGTENVPAIAGLGQAVSELYTGFDDKISRMYELKHKFINQIIKLPGVYINGVTSVSITDYSMEQIKNTAPHIMSVSFEGVRSEVLLHALEEKGIYVSAGSACSSHHSKVSATLSAIGIDKKLLDSTLRFSVSILNTPEEIDYTIEQIRTILPALRLYSRK